MMDIPRPEHPRPDFERRNWQNLNGEWEFAIDSAKSGIGKGWQTGTEFPKRIIVPFCPESKLSGIEHMDFMEAVWYRRKFIIPHGERILLHFGAVDYEARVWVNGREVAYHRGGYTPFSADITDALNAHGDNELVVYAVDDIRSDCQPSGKQSHRSESYGCMYTRTTGIWQTVWVEAVSETHISSLTILPDAVNARVSLEISVEKPRSGIRLEATASSEGKVVADETLESVSDKNAIILKIPDAILWQPGKPFLYDLQLQLLDGDKVIDDVSSYFGLRDVLIEGDRILINGKPVFQRLILDQGFWPDGIYTAPSDDELKADVERSMAMGFNGARLHQKVFEPRTLYWADKLGYLIWGEFPDWGCSNKLSAQARENFLREWKDVVIRDRSHPSIIAWTPQNEAHLDSNRYNPSFMGKIYDITKKLDPSRPIIDASGYVHVKTDIWDLHDYDQNTESFKARYDQFGKNPKTETLPRNDSDHEPEYKGQPVVVSEYGGTWWNPDQQGNDAWGYGDRPADEKTFLDRFKGLADTLLDNPHIAGFCYTQLTDVEQEVNGLYMYNRKPKFLPEIIKPIIERPAAIER